MIRRSALIASCLAIGCAQSIPGVDPPGDELFFPIGLTVIQDASGRPAHLAVLSSNFDQRYNSGTINAYSIGALFALATCSATSEPEPCFRDDPNGPLSLRNAQTDTLRVFSFGGDLIYAPTDAPNEGHLFVSARGRNRLTLVNVDTEGEKLLRCSTADESLERVLGSDCTRAFVVNTGFADPFALAHAPATADRPTDLVAIGHVAATEQNNVVVGAVSLANVDVFEERTVQEMTTGEGEGFPEPVQAVAVGSFGGVSGMAFAGDILDLKDVFLSTTLHSAPDLLMAAFTAVDLGGGDYELALAQDQVPVLQLSQEIQATEMRSLAVGRDAGGNATRAYASVRFTASGDSYNAGIAVIDLTGTQLRILSVLEVGEELQRPFLYDVPSSGRRFLYVGDIRRDKIYVLDVSTDQPLLIKEIDGRTMRTIDGEAVQARLLDGPSQFAFVSDGTRTLGFVTNFTNSTLAVLDVSDPDPRLHRIVARLGRNIDPEGEMEKP